MDEAFVFLLDENEFGIGVGGERVAGLASEAGEADSAAAIAGVAEKLSAISALGQ